MIMNVLVVGSRHGGFLSPALENVLVRYRKGTSLLSVHTALAHT